jgi:hypothetical protein
MASASVREANRAVKGRTGRLNFKRRKTRGIVVKRTKHKFADDTWDSPQGIERPRQPKVR